jgi:hypothetical protein
MGGSGNKNFFTSSNFYFYLLFGFNIIRQSYVFAARIDRSISSPTARIYSSLS